MRYGLVILSDGKDTKSENATLALLEAMLAPLESDAPEIQIHAIDIGDDDGEVLKKIAASTHGSYSKVEELDDQAEIYREIASYY